MMGYNEGAENNKEIVWSAMVNALHLG